jgi:hypothetical protein
VRVSVVLPATLASLAWVSLAVVGALGLGRAVRIADTRRSTAGES